MNKVMRVGDQVHGTCSGPGHAVNLPFVGTFLTGSGTVQAQGKGIVRIGDTGITDCGHTIRALTGSAVALADGIAIHRVGDTGEALNGVTPCGTFTSDTSDTTTESD